MFCGKCGTENSCDAGFCANCGAKLNRKNETQESYVSVVSQSDKNRKIGIIAVAVVIIAVVASLFFLFGGIFGGRSYEATVQQFIDCQFNGNVEGILELMPEKMITYAMEHDEYDSNDIDDLIDELDEQLHSQLDTLDNYLGEGWKASHEIVSVENVIGSELNDIKDAYSDADVEVSEAKNVEVEITVMADETEVSNSLDVAVVKVGNSWYLDAMSMGNLF